MIRSSWIRPEDVEHYERLGIDWFKVIDRGMTSDTIARIVAAYVARRYRGNLLDLFPDPSRSIVFGNKYFFRKLRYFFRPLTVNVFRLKKFSSLLPSPFFIENAELDGFLEYIIEKGECENASCEECGYCDTVAREKVSIDRDRYERIQEAYGACLDDIVSGNLFRFFFL